MTPRLPAPLKPMLLVLAGLLVVSPWAAAVMLTVGPGGPPDYQYAKIQDAINAANDGDTVQVAAGTYYEALVWRTKSLQLLGAGAGHTIVDASQRYGRCLAIGSVPATARVQGFRFTHGRGGVHVSWSSPTIKDNEVTENEALDAGGGIRIRGSGSAPTLIGNVIANNIGRDYGGGVAVQEGAWPTFVGNQITSNRVVAGSYERRRGGGVYVSDNCRGTFSDNEVSANKAREGAGLYLTWCWATLTANHIENNLAEPESQGSGGGLYSLAGQYGTVALRDNVIAGNSSFRGGGLLLYPAPDPSSLTLDNNTIASNTATASGGGLAIGSGAPALGRNTIRGNQAGACGGGVWVDSSLPSFSGNMILGNSAKASGGGLFLGGWSWSDTLLVNNLIAANSAPSAAGVWVGAQQTPALANNTIARNSGEGLYVEPSTSRDHPPTITNCILWSNDVYDLGGDPCTVTYSDIGTGFISAPGNISADPRFVDPAALDYRLRPGSPCIDAGTNAVANLPLLDIEGNPRIRPAGGTVDMGAYEAPPNAPPVANAGDDQLVEANTVGGAEVTLHGSGSSDPDGDALTYLWTWTDAGGNGGTATGESPTVFLPLGETTVTLVVNDGQEDSDPDQVAIEVQDTTPPSIENLAADPSDLWPPNGKMRDVTLSYTLSDVADDSLTGVVSVTCNEASFDSGDYEIIDATHLRLRAEREGKSTAGRLYTVAVTCTDDSSNTTTSTVTVTVPHDQRTDSAGGGACVGALSAVPTASGAQVVLSLTAPAGVDARVLNIAGRPVRTLCQGKAFAAGAGTLLWNARSDTGLSVPGGTYLIEITARAADGSRSRALATVRLSR